MLFSVHRNHILAYFYLSRMILLSSDQGISVTSFRVFFCHIYSKMSTDRVLHLSIKSNIQKIHTLFSVHRNHILAYFYLSRMILLSSDQGISVTSFRVFFCHIYSKISTDRVLHLSTKSNIQKIHMLFCVDINHILAYFNLSRMILLSFDHGASVTSFGVFFCHICVKNSYKQSTTLINQNQVSKRFICILVCT